MKQGFFVTGTDTGVGKTLVSASLILALRHNGLQVCGMKPVASGCIETGNGLKNEDADMLCEAANVSADYDLICPYRFLPPIAPHIAAQEQDVIIESEHIMHCFQHLASSSDAVVVEGVGGWQVPVNDRVMMADIAIALGLPVVLVVGGRLGCINHALLTLESIQRSGLPLAGWVFNQVEPEMQRRAVVLAELEKLIPAPLLADISWQIKPDMQLLAKSLNKKI